MTSNSSKSRKWLRKNIEKGNIRLYSFDDFVDPIYIGVGGYGTVFKAKMKTLGRTMAYKLLHSNNEDEMIENFVKEVGNYKVRYSLIIIALLKLPKRYF